MVRSLADPELLLRAWEQASSAPVAARSAVFVHLAGLSPDLDSALDLDVGACATLAAHAHAVAFGREVTGVVACQSCGELMDAQVSLPPAEDLTVAPAAREQDAVVGDFTVRPLTTRHLIAATADPDKARTVLLSCCVRRSDGTPFDPSCLTAEEETLLDVAAERLTGQALLMLRMQCPQCDRPVPAALDPGAVLWDQIDMAALRLMEDVAVLARAFGWSEADVLALPTSRRNAYLERAES
ncbi:hypothetical protein [Streptomyces flavochromogenes]|uniref:hypothetical protein n=1 Tax=Streptomyces flavochromogenes TaxID=68199 RepID=UPI00068D0187|nr:hypothetical protein [Streptomyces flavochromogenes]